MVPLVKPEFATTPTRPLVEAKAEPAAIMRLPCVAVKLAVASSTPVSPSDVPVAEMSMNAPGTFVTAVIWAFAEAATPTIVAKAKVEAIFMFGYSSVDQGPVSALCSLWRQGPSRDEVQERHKTKLPPVNQNASRIVVKRANWTQWNLACAVFGRFEQVLRGVLPCVINGIETAK